MSRKTESTEGQHGDGLEPLARGALSRWGLAGDTRLDLIKHRENAVFGVRTADGHRFVLRVHRADYHSDASIRSELQWMTALREAGIATPAVIPTPDGELFVRVGFAGLTHEHQCDLLSWVSGTPLGSAEERAFSAEEAVARTYLATGRLAARIHNQATSWSRPAGFERPSWDEAGCLGPDALWGHWSDLDCLTAEERTVLADAAGVAVEVLGRFGKAPDRYGLVHSDLVPDNLLDDGAQTAVIDFDDCGFGWHLWEMATGCTGTWAGIATGPRSTPSCRATGSTALSPTTTWRCCRCSSWCGGSSTWGGSTPGARPRPPARSLISSASRPRCSPGKWSAKHCGVSPAG